MIDNRFIELFIRKRTMKRLFCLSSFTSKSEVKNEICTEISCQGKHCNGTVGCDRPGFSPVQHKEVWKQAYCRHCGHHRRSQK